MSQRSEAGLITETRGHVRVLTLDRPERRNALSSGLQAALVDELLDCAADADVRAVVLTGLWVFPGILLLVGPVIWFVLTNRALNGYWRSAGAR